MKPLPYVELVLQRGHGDCGIAALAMFLGEAYEDVLAAAIAPKRKAPHRHGMYTRELQRASKALGTPLALKRVWDMDEAAGLLTVERVNKQPDQFVQHLVLLKWGLVFDTDGKCWEPETYMAQHNFKPISLLVAEDTEL